MQHFHWEFPFKIFRRPFGRQRNFPFAPGRRPKGSGRHPIRDVANGSCAPRKFGEDFQRRCRQTTEGDFRMNVCSFSCTLRPPRVRRAPEGTGAGSACLPSISDWKFVPFLSLNFPVTESVYRLFSGARRFRPEPTKSVHPFRIDELLPSVSIWLLFLCNRAFSFLFPISLSPKAPRPSLSTLQNSLVYCDR